MPDLVGHDDRYVTTGIGRSSIGQGMMERRSGIPSRLFLLFISLLNGGTGGDSLFLVLFPAVMAQ